MLEQSLMINLSSPGISETTISRLRYEYQTNQNLFQKQPMLVQQFLVVQAISLAEAIVDGLPIARFSLPDRVVVQDRVTASNPIPIPARYRTHMIGGLLRRLTHADIVKALHSSLLELEHSANLAVSSSSILLRYALVMHLVHNSLPVGRSVQYIEEKKDEIPNIPVHSDGLSGLVTTSEADTADYEQDRGVADRGEFDVPYVESARGFYMPQWVAFDTQQHLLVKDLNEAKTQIVAMKRYLLVLQTAAGLASYMVADEEYQRKRYGILGQLVNQGRALASYEVDEIIRSIKVRSSSHDLDRGFSLSLPYFNDQTLGLEMYCFDVIPAGRVMFVPAFVVLAVRAQGAKVAQDTCLNRSTRRHLLIELSKLEETFLR